MPLSFDTRKKITIEVNNVDPSGCKGYDLYHIRSRREPRRIARNVDDGQILELIGERNFQKFEDNAYRFVVSAERVITLFQYLP